MREGDSHMAAPYPSVRKQPVQSRSNATFEAILEAAIQVLLRLGYRRFTTARVAERAGVSVGTLYQYFPNKQAVIRELVRRHVRRVADRVCQALDSGGDDRARLRRMVSAFVDAKRDNAELSRALREPLLELDKRDLVREGIDAVAARLLPLIARMHPDLMPERQRIMAFLLVSSVEAPVIAALDDQPHLLADPDFAAELTAMAEAHLVRAAEREFTPRATSSPDPPA